MNCISTAVIGLQWGDEGKGKIVDYLAQDFDSVIRFNGGNNAGHTVVVGSKSYKLRILPSGVLRPGIVSVIGSGVVLDPKSLLGEIDMLSAEGIITGPHNLMVADNCHLILSVHKELDALFEKSQKIGTTRCGIGPCYQDKVARRGIRVADLYSDAALKNSIEKLLYYHNILRVGAGIEKVKEKDILDELLEIRDKILIYAAPPCLIESRLSKKTKLFEGAQGMLLDIDHGTYPFVTSSSSGLGQVISGGALGNIERVVGVIKSYTTRVGEGIFPTWQQNDSGSRLQEIGKEVGTVSGRIRRCGWLDLVLIRYAMSVSCVDSIIMTKLDVLDSFDEIKICNSYITSNGDEILVCSPTLMLREKLEPQYITLKGWKVSTSDVSKFSDLPVRATAFVQKVQELLGKEIFMISVGPEREQILWT